MTDADRIKELKSGLDKLADSAIANVLELREARNRVRSLRHTLFECEKQICKDGHSDMASNRNGEFLVKLYTLLHDTRSP